MWELPIWVQMEREMQRFNGRHCHITSFVPCVHFVLKDHLEGCKYGINPGCGERVLLSEMEEHLKNCSQRQVECKDCGKIMSFIKLQVCSVVV